VPQQFGGRFPMHPGRYTGARFWRPPPPGPVFVSAVQVSQASAVNETATTPSFTPAPYEVLVLKAGTGIDTQTIGTPSGGGLTWTRRVEQPVGTGTTSGALIATAVVPAVSPGPMTVSVVFAGTTGAHSVVVERWANAALAGSPAVNGTKTGTATTGTTVTTVGGYSAVAWVDADFNAVAPGTPAYLSGAAPVVAAFTSASNVTVYAAYQQALAPGSQTFGVSAPSGQAWTDLGIELLYAAPPSLVDQAPVTPQVVALAAVLRASTY
jgi:hypothetical protein